ncbi:MAG TPA: hypothetical protein VHN20_00105 [Beijerinckiaceae bacterium]|nr:hypothetical protein [Beijerinckiaceae bacterium]
MLVYGDRTCRAGTSATLADLTRAVARATGMPCGIQRHGALVDVFIEASKLVQGIADAELEARRCDADSPAQDAGMGLLMAFAVAIRQSWDTGFAQIAALSPHLCRPLEATRLPESVRATDPEGYAFYALFPEAYLEAARGLGSATPNATPLRVIGIRSIGTGLAALVAAALGARNPITVRPAGDPFNREIRLSDELAAGLVRDAARFAIVDEGPGLSGSSFGAVADLLEDAGVPAGHIHFFPGHMNGLGPMASPRHRERWARASRRAVDFDRLILHSTDPAHRLESWVADLTGAAETPLHDLSGGAWRARHFSDVADWPPSHVQQERRKFLLRASGATWLLKFVGLGREGAHKFELARQLHVAGFAPEPAGCRYGFLVERWVEQATPLQPHAFDRDALVSRLAAYIGFRARAFPAAPDHGASLSRLLQMARRNTELGLSAAHARQLEPWESEIVALEPRVRRVRGDNRLHPWEWLLTADGRLIKTDAIDHHAAHDLIGCQDVTWDIAGASIEFDLSAAEQAGLCAAVECVAHTRVDRRLLAFSQPCYAAFQLGYWSLASHSLAGHPAEAMRTRAAADRYTEVLARLLW